MSELLTEARPQIVVNGEEREQRGDPAAKEEECVTTASLERELLEDGVAAEREAPLKMQSVFQQVRKQIRSQVSANAPKTTILQLVQKIKDRDAGSAQVSSEPRGNDASGEEEKQGLTDECKDEMNPEEKELCAVFEEKLEASERALKEEFQAQISQVRTEMQAYTDQALRDLESKMHAKEQEGKAQDRRQKNPAAPPLASRRGRVLTRTMTTIIPKTCPPVIVGPRAKSETLSSSKVENSRFLPRDPVLPIQGSKLLQSRKPPLSAHPPLHQRKKSVQAKTKTGARLEGK